MIAATVLFIEIDCYYLLWVQTSLKQQFPAYITTYISAAALGFSEEMGKTLHANWNRFRAARKK